MFHESSGMRSPLDSDSLHKAWKKNAKSTEQVYRLTQAVEQIQRELNRLRLKKGGGGGASTPTTGMVFRGLWNNAVSYSAQNVVFRTPVGGNSGAYIGIEDNIPIGTLPESGAPWWASWPYPPPGVWG